MNRRFLSILILLSIVFISTGRGGNAQSPAHAGLLSALAPQDLMALIRNDVMRAYKNLDDPNYDFKREARPPFEIVEKLRADGFQVHECPDNDADVCFAYCVLKDGKDWSLMVSMVGPYAVLFRNRGPNRSQHVAPIRSRMLPQERAIAAILNSSVDASNRNYKLIDFPTLSRRFGLKCMNTRRDKVMIYQVLFRDLNELPWLRG